jgi:flagellar motor switch protein FliM
VFNTQMDDELELRCGHFPMFKGPVGQRQGYIAVRVEQYISPKEDED